MFIKGVYVNFENFHQVNDKNKTTLKQKGLYNNILRIEKLNLNGATPFEDTLTLVVNENNRSLIADLYKKHGNNSSIKIMTFIDLICFKSNCNVAISNPSLLSGWCGWNFIPTPVIFIQKPLGQPKNAFKLNFKQADLGVPVNLKHTIKIDKAHSSVILYCMEGDYKLEVNPSNEYVIAFEEITKEAAQEANAKNNAHIKPGPDGKIYNIWWKKNAATTLKEVNGVFLSYEPPRKAQLVTEKFPSFIGTKEELQNRLRQGMGGWQYLEKEGDNVKVANNYKGFWVLHDEQKKRFQVIHSGTDTANQYYICNGKQERTNITLQDYYNKLIQGYDVTNTNNIPSA